MTDGRPVSPAARYFAMIAAWEEERGRRMHTGPMKDSDGDFTKAKPAPGVRCHACKAAERVTVQVWHSKCGGYEDDKYTCGACGHSWWVEGPDA